MYTSRAKYFIVFLLLVMLQVSITPSYASSPGVISISAGASHCLALTGDGSVLAWGNNDYGQLGDGTNVSTSAPVKVRGLGHVIAIAAGPGHSLALVDDGTVWAWGDNYHGTLGDGTAEDRFTPVQASGLTNVKAIAAGTMVSFALKNDSTLWAWGFNKRGGLGDGTFEDRLTPVQVKELTNVIKIGHEGIFAITDDGSVWAWGNNLIIESSNSSIYGILGDNYNEIRPTPFQIGQLSDVKAITNGAEHTVFIKDDGTVWTWGINNKGQLGNNAKIDDYAVTTTPVKAIGLNNVKEISAGIYFSLALKNDGSVWKWGEDYYTIPTMPGVYAKSVSVPKQIDGLERIKDISSGHYFYIALGDDGSVWGWGYNENGQLGNHGSFVSMQVKIIDGSGDQISTPTAYSHPSTNTSVNNTVIPLGETRLPNATALISGINNNTTTNQPTMFSLNNWIDIKLIGLIGLVVIIIGAAYILFMRRYK